jgi:hypothetical protein
MRKESTMRKRITLNYCLWHTEVYEVDIDAEDLEAFDEDPIEFVCDENKVDGWTGDVMNGTWETNVEDINVLDHMVGELEKEDDTPIPFQPKSELAQQVMGIEPNELTLTRAEPGDLNGLPFREVSSDS